MSDAKKNRVGKTRDLFKKIGDTKEEFHTKTGTIKDRNGKDLTEAGEAKKRWQAYTEELYKTALNDPDNHDDVVTHLEPDILECEVKWALGSIATTKASGDDGIPAELFQILRYDAIKMLHLFCQQNLENLAKATRLEKIRFHSSSKERQCQRVFKFVLVL